MTPAHRDLSTTELWDRSLERSRKRRALLPRARREQNRRKGVSAVAAAATMAGTGTPMAFAQGPSGDLQAEVAAETASQRAIEVRDGGLPLRLGSQGPLVAHVQKELGVQADGIFGVQTDAAVRQYQSRMGLDVDGIVGPHTWGTLFESAPAVGGSNVPPSVKQQLEQKLANAGARVDSQAGVRQPGEGLFGGQTQETTVQAETGAQAGGGDATESPAGGQTETPSAGGGQEPTTPVSGDCSSTVSPVNGTVTSEFGPRWGRNHDGLDIAAPTGTAVRAAACGSVTVAGTQDGYGNIVCVTHTSSFSTCYAHLSRFATTQGAQVSQGQVIGYVGCTGSCTGPHLHFETRVNGQAEDPRGHLAGASPSRSATNSSAVGPTTPTAPPGTPEAMYDKAAAEAEAEALAQIESSGSGGAMAEATESAAVEAVAAEGVTAEGVPAETAPVDPYAAPVPAEAAPVDPYAAPVPAEAAPVDPYAAPVPAATAPADPYAAPVPAEAAPVDPYAAPVPAEAAPVPAETAPAPVEPAPVVPAPVEAAPAPVEPAPVVPAPVEAAPAPVAPAPAPVAPAPVEAAPVAPAPAAPAEAAPAPVDPAAQAAAPADVAADASATTSVSGGVPAQ